MISLVIGVLPFILIFFIGYWMTILFGVKNELERVGLSWLLGTFWFTLTSFLLHVFGGFSYELPLVLSVLILSAAGFGVLATFRMPSFTTVKNYARAVGSYSLIEKIVLLLLFFLILESLLQNLFWPISDWDALALYDFRALVLTETGNFNEGEELGYFFQYPPYTSLLHAVSYIFHFEAAKVWYTLIYISFIGIFGALVRTQTTRLLAVISMLILALSPQVFPHSMIAYTNLSYTAFYVLGTIYMWKWLQDYQYKNVILGSVLVAGSLWIRLSEPFWIINCLLLLIGALRNLKHIPLVIVCLALILFTKNIWPVLVERINSTNAYQAPIAQTIIEPEAVVEAVPPASGNKYLNRALVFIGIYGTLSQITNNSLAEIYRHVQEVNQYFLTFVTPLFNHLIVPWILVVLFEWAARNKLKLLIESGTLILILSMIWIGTFIFSFIFVTWNQIGESATRMSMFLPPLFFYTIITSTFWHETTYISDLVKKYRGNHRR